jgi:NTP pyrophosphatase (non-canonical NTP hydrolase)
MNRLDELLLILSEECAEIIQATSKCRRFGMDSTHNEESNRERLEHELGDFLAMFKLLMEETNLSEAHIMECAEAKLLKVEQFMTNGTQPAPHRRKPKNRAKIAREIARFVSP